tara:strand:- start:2571 stop:3158 length:588 start_codon:yes stop_codon:yes gene_type:complete
MSPIEIAWVFLKGDDAMRVRPFSQDDNQFQAYRTIPMSAVQQTLMEGIEPRAPSSLQDKNILDRYTGSTDPAIWSFGRNKLSNKQWADLAEEHGEWSTQGNPLLAGEWFKDTWGGVTDDERRDRKAIIGIKTRPAGKITEDKEFAQGRDKVKWHTRPQISRKRILPEHLEHVVPVDYDDNRLIYDGDDFVARRVA